MSTLEGQVAVVTGAGRGIGRAIAERLAAEGARVALVSRSADQLEEVAAAIGSSGGAALAIAADVTDWTAVQGMAERTETELGPIDLLVNNAGSLYAIGPTWEADPERWWTDVTINILGVFLCCRAVLPGMVARNRGRVLNMIGGGTGSPFPNAGAYASSKAAVMRFTETLTEELRQAKAKVTVFATGPGLVRTALTEYQLVSPEGQRYMSQIGRLFEEGRDVPPTLAANLVASLATGRFDRLAGRCFGAGEDLEAILTRQDEIISRDEKTLRFR